MLPACKPGSVEFHLVTVIPLGAWSPTPSSSLPAASWSGRAVPRCLFGLAPTGVCRAANVTARAVSSYLTVSPLPVSDVRTIGGLLSVALSVGAHHPAQALPGSAPYGARTFLEHGSTRDHPADSIHIQDSAVG
jgi:hypothetical protein